MNLAPFLKPVVISTSRALTLTRLQLRHPRKSFDELNAMIVGLPTLEDEQRNAIVRAEMDCDRYLARISQGELNEYHRKPYVTVDDVFAAAERKELGYKNSKPWTASDADYLAAAQKEVDEFIGWEEELEPIPEGIAREIARCENAVYNGRRFKNGKEVSSAEFDERYRL